MTKVKDSLFHRPADAAVGQKTSVQPEQVFRRTRCRGGETRFALTFLPWVSGFPSQTDLTGLHPGPHPHHPAPPPAPPPAPACLTRCHLSPGSPTDDNVCLTVDKSDICPGSACTAALRYSRAGATQPSIHLSEPPLPPASRRSCCPWVLKIQVIFINHVRGGDSDEPVDWSVVGVH